LDGFLLTATRSPRTQGDVEASFGGGGIQGLDDLGVERAVDVEDDAEEVAPGAAEEASASIGPVGEPGSGVEDSLSRGIARPWGTPHHNRDKGARDPRLRRDVREGGPLRHAFLLMIGL
jgi:hypothetical protein